MYVSFFQVHLKDTNCENNINVPLNLDNGNSYLVCLLFKVTALYGVLIKTLHQISQILPKWFSSTQ